MAVTQKLIVIGLLLLATLATGFLRSSSGIPFHAILVTVHKLLAVAWVIYAAVLVFHTARQVEFKTAFFAAVAVLGVSIVALFWSGSVLTMPQLATSAWLTLHRIASVFAVIAAAVTARLILLIRQ